MIAPLLIDLDDAAALDGAITGRKAATLALLRAAGYPVPEGVVVPAGADVAAATRAVTERFGDAARLVVRSSSSAEDLAERSYAGQYVTVLDVSGRHTVAAAIERVRASADDPAARGYGPAHAGAMAVLVMPLVEADAAGAAFTADPVTGEPHLVIEAVAGLGEALAAGTALPERWILAAGEAVAVAPRGVLAADQVEQVAELARSVAAREGRPQDIEWAIAGDLVHLLQARPITALPPRR